MDGIRKSGMALAAFLAMMIAGPVHAAVFELSGAVAYGKANLGPNASSRQNRYTAEFAWRFTKVSAIELSFMRTRSKMSQTVALNSVLVPTLTQALTYDDDVYSASCVQNLVPANFIIQPYFKVGGGRLIRKQKAEYSNQTIIENQEISQRVETGVGGVGCRLFLTKSMALKGELVTYVPRFQFSKWKDSQMFSVGLSWIF